VEGHLLRLLRRRIPDQRTMQSSLWYREVQNEPRNYKLSILLKESKLHAGSIP